MDVIILTAASTFFGLALIGGVWAWLDYRKQEREERRIMKLRDEEPPRWYEDPAIPRYRNPSTGVTSTTPPERELVDYGMSFCIVSTDHTMPLLTAAAVLEAYCPYCKVNHLIETRQQALICEKCGGPLELAKATRAQPTPWPPAVDPGKLIYR